MPRKFKNGSNEGLRALGSTPHRQGSGRGNPRWSRRRNLIRLGIHPQELYQATRSHRGYWFMPGTSLVQRALDNRWLAERGVPSLVEQSVELPYGKGKAPFTPLPFI